MQSSDGVGLTCVVVGVGCDSLIDRVEVWVGVDDSVEEVGTVVGVSAGNRDTFTTPRGGL